MRRAGWGSVLTAIGTLAYYVAYAYIVWRTLHGDFTIGDLTFLAGSFRRLRNLLENLLMGFSQVAGQALYLDDLFSFFEIQPEIVPPPNPRPFPVPIQRRLRVRERGLPLSRRRALGGAQSEPSSCAPARSSRWSARTAPARRRWSSCWRACTTRTRAASCSTATTCASTTCSRCAPISASSSRTSCATTSRAADNIAVGRIEARDDRAAHRRGRGAQPGRRSHRQAAAGLRPGARQAVPHRASTCPAVSGRRSRSRAPTCATRSC